ncbi:flavin-containing monooxygenase [Nocardia thailandica]|uniref:Flavin-containing monooxygenase n=1 Tax=Nocardia thailandica TaxID=257275 RepID=A0ABW6PQC5_9NOCA
MTSGSRIGIVGAGVAGLACAKVLSRAGFSVEVFDRTPDVGGVWSATRRHPGLRARSSTRTYRFSDHPVPADFPRRPDGEQVQAYLADYARVFGLEPLLRLRTEVVAADPVDSGWLVETRDESGGHRSSFDHLVVANGVHSAPAVPEYPGLAAFQAAGGRLGHVSALHDPEAARDRSVVVVGYGQSAWEVATALSRYADDTQVVARRLTWKLPERGAGGVDVERLQLTRTGVAHLNSPAPGRAERALRALALRQSNADLLRERLIRKQGLRELGLVPDEPIETVTGPGSGDATEGFLDQVRAGRIVVHAGAEIAEVIGGAQGPAVRLADGTLLLADLVVCATGYRQQVPFLTPFARRGIIGEDGAFRLYRHILPVEVPNLTFAGYNSSAAGPLTSEIGAHWIAALLTGRYVPPTAAEMNAEIDERLAWAAEHAPGEPARGVSVEPFTLRHADQLLADLGKRLPLRHRVGQWFRPVHPGAYRDVLGGTAAAEAAPAQPVVTGS